MNHLEVTVSKIISASFYNIMCTCSTRHLTSCVSAWECKRLPLGSLWLMLRVTVYEAPIFSKCLCAHVRVWASVLCTFVCVSASECVCGHDLHCTCSSPGHPGNDLCSSSLDRPSNNLHNLSGLSWQSSTQTIPATIYTISLDYPDNHLHCSSLHSPDNELQWSPGDIVCQVTR